MRSDQHNSRIVRPLSTAQRAFWDKQTAEPGAAAGVIVGLSIDIFAPVQPDLFRTAAQALIDHSDALRTSFVVVDGELSQVILPEVAVAFHVLDLSGPVESDASRARAVGEWSQQPFDLSIAPLIDHLLVRVGPEHWTWHCRCHHLTIDAGGAAIGINFILQTYATLAAGGTPDMPPLGSYLDYVESEREYVASEQYRDDLAYWIERHAAEPARLFRAGEGEPGNVTPKQHVLDRCGYDALLDACRTEGVQPFHACVASLAAMAFRLFGHTGVSFGLATHNRTTELDRRTVGLFAGTMAFRLDVDPNESLGALARRASRQLRRDYRHARLPLNHLAAVLGRTEAPLFDLALSFYPAGHDMDVGGARVSLRSGIFAGMDTEPAAIHVRDPQGDSPLGVDLTHRPDLVRSDDVVAMYDGFVRLLGEWPQARTTTIADLVT
jgi:hypothetical protein